MFLLDREIFVSAFIISLFLKSSNEFHQAMQSWDKARADVAAAGITRTLEATQVLELFADNKGKPSIVYDYRPCVHQPPG